MASASVTVDSQLISSIGKGVLVFAAIAEKDTLKDAEAMAAKVLKIKMWEDDTGRTVGLIPMKISEATRFPSNSDQATVEEKCGRDQRRSALWSVDS